MVTHSAALEIVQVQSRSVAMASVPGPPPGPNDAGELVADVWHLVEVGALTDVDVDVQLASAAVAARAAASVRNADRMGCAFASHARCSPHTAEVHLECHVHTVEYHITQYELEQGALEIQYIEEFFGEFPRKKTATEIVKRLNGRSHLILLANAPLPADPGSVVPVSYKVAHEISIDEDEPKLKDLVARLRDFVKFDGRRVLYTWIGGTRRDWRGQGHFRALTEQQELWAISHGFDEIVVKTKNKFYEMRGTLDHLRFEVVKYERHHGDNAESKVYLSKKLLPEILDEHRSAKTVVQVPV